MKKLLILAAMIVAGAAANAASFKWTASNIYGADGNKFAGEITLMAYESASDISTAFVATTFTPATAGVVNKTFSSDAFTSDVAYDFYMVMSQTVDSQEYTFTSAVKGGVVAQATTTAAIGFGNMATATQAAGAWTAAAVPEPTSGLLLLLGMAGLALKRKRA